MADTPDDQCPSRFVILAGPGKTGSTSVQSFFKMRADQRYDRISRMANWTFPMDHAGRHCWSLYSRKLGENLTSVKKIKDEWNSITQAPRNFFWVCEMAAHLWTRDPKGKALYDVMDGLGVACPEFVISYRSPRVEHFLSAWKQITRERPERHLVGLSVTALVCQEDAKKFFRSMIPYYTNPLGAAWEYRMPHANERNSSTNNSNWPVKILDLSGIAKLGLDVSHVIGCEILNFPCYDGWIEGIRRTDIRFNERNREVVGITPAQYDAIERLYRRLDCAYRDRLSSDPKVTILFKDTLWNDCPDQIPESYFKLEDVEYFLGQIESIMDCPGSIPSELGARVMKKTAIGRPPTEVDEHGHWPFSVTFLLITWLLTAVSWKRLKTASKRSKIHM